MNWFLQFIITIFIVCLGFVFHRLLKNNTPSKFFLFGDHSSSSSTTSFWLQENRKKMNMAAASCAVCANFAKKRCSGCKIISYCSVDCQRSHWISEHKAKCNNLKLISKTNSTSTRQERKTSSADVIVHHSGKILFPYDEYVELSDWEIPGFPPCGLLNCGNSCFANVVLQCLAYTKPLVAYLLIQGHKRECRRNDWCFLCEFQTHLERASHSSLPFSPINILSRLPNIGGNLGRGSQEDAHEFMRFVIDAMQSVCLDQFGGEKAVHPRAQETTLIQHIFGGQLQSQVICTKCDNISNQLENMMDLTVEIQGDATSLEECLDQFTVKERLHGENMYKCDRCNEYVPAWKRLSVRLPPNILTIALKRFQSGRFGKLNKKVMFPEKLDLGPYMSKSGGDNDIYKLYGVIVHVDMLNASFFGHYICYVKDFCGQWYRVDDCKVARVDVDEVLSQGAYMLLYSRARVRPRCINPLQSDVPEIKNGVEHNEDSRPSIEQSNVECLSVVKEGVDSIGDSDSSAVTMNPLESNKADPGATPFVETDIGVNFSDELSIAPSSDEIAIAPSENSNGLVPSFGDNSLSCKSVEEDVIEKVADTILISDVKENKSEGGNSNGSMGDTSFALANGKSETTSVEPGYLSDVEENKSGGDSSNGTIKDASFALATGKSETSCVKPGYTEHLTSTRCIPEVARKCNGTDKSGLKLKPMFSPGFLGKQQQKHSIKKIAGVLGKQQKPASCGVCCSSSNGFVNTNMHTLNHSFTDKENSCGSIEALSNNLRRDTDMVDVDFADQEARDLASPDIPNRIIGGNMVDVKELVDDKPDQKDTSFALANGKSETTSVKPICNYDVEENKSGGDSNNGSMKDTSFASVKPGYAEHLTSSSCIPEVARKCNGTDKSGLKLKPIFSPGFLGKQQKKKCIKRTAGVLGKQQKPASSGVCCSTSNGFANPYMHTLNHSFTDKKNSCGSTEALSNNLRRDTDMVDVDAKELVEDKPDH